MRRGARDHRGRGGLLARLPIGVGIAGSAVGLLHCSLLLDWSDYTSAPGTNDWDADLGGDAGGADVRIFGSDLSDSVADVPHGPRCVPNAPPGWTGPLAFFINATGSQLPACGSDFPVPAFDGFEGLNAPPASCSMCTCGTPEGSSCIPPTFTAYSDFLCTAPCGSPVAVTDTACVAPPSCSFQAFKVSAAGVDAGACSPSAVTSTKAQWMWSREARACALSSTPTAASCKADEVWLSPPAPPFSPRLCVMNSEKVPCPNSVYSQSMTLYSTQEVNDTRDCSDCSCAAPTDSSCTIVSPPAAGVAYDAMCNMPFLSQSFTVPTSRCQPLWTPGIQVSNLKLTQPLTLNPGSCAPGGGQPTGAATPTGAAVTVCCTLP